jgi:hypothetical protein
LSRKRIHVPDIGSYLHHLNPQLPHPNFSRDFKPISDVAFPQSEMHMIEMQQLKVEGDKQSEAAYSLHVSKGVVVPQHFLALVVGECHWGCHLDVVSRAAGLD